MIIILIKKTQVLGHGSWGRQFLERVGTESRSYLFLLKDLQYILPHSRPLPLGCVRLPDGCETWWFWPGHQLATLILFQQGRHCLPVIPLEKWRQLSYASLGTLGQRMMPCVQNTSCLGRSGGEGKYCVTRQGWGVGGRAGEERKKRKL